MAVQYAFAKIVTDGLALAVDAADPTSYSGGTTWRDITPNNNSGTISGSVAYSTAYKGGFIFSGPTASIAFSTNTANFGTGSFTVEMAFSPSSINGIHWLASKNSGSFPSWGIYLSGSNNSGKLFSEFRISSAVATSISSSTTFTTGSVYQVDVRILPSLSASGFYIDGAPIGGATGSAGGSLTNTGSLFLGNSAPSSSQAFSGSIYATKIYLNATTEQPPRNFNAIALRFSKQLITDTAKKQYDILVVGGGGGNGGYGGGGGGAGGLITFSTTQLPGGVSTVIIGNGGLGTSGFGGSGAPGQNSIFNTFIAIGGGAGGVAPTTGGSGGGGAGWSSGVSGAAGTLGQGNAGGNGITGDAGAGGGGAGSVGLSNPNSTTGGTGGSGSYLASFAAIGGSPAGWFAGGGGGAGSSVGGTGGIGGGGNGLSGGVANTGGGAGGSSNQRGGTGIVAIRYNGTPIAIGGEITQSAGYTYHVFRTTGTSSFTIF
jgi:hypothetical protein